MPEMATEFAQGNHLTEDGGSCPLKEFYTSECISISTGQIQFSVFLQVSATKMKNCRILLKKQ